MKVWARMLAISAAALAGATAAEGAVTVDPATQQRLGVATAVLTVAQEDRTAPAFARVLDPLPLAMLDSEIVAAAAALEASRAEAARARALNAADAAMSTRAMQAAEAQARADQASLTLLRRRLGLEWGDGVARLSDARRAALLDALAAGRAALVRIDTPQGRGLAGLRSVDLDLPDGSRVRGAVLGPARSADPRLASPGLLALVSGAAARQLTPNLLVSGTVPLGGSEGVLAPRASVMRAGGHAFVYVQTGPAAFERRVIDGATPAPDGLVAHGGLSAGERVVTSGAAALYAAETAAAAEGE